MPEPTVMVTRYAVSCIPEDNINCRYLTLHVEYRGDGQWVVCEPGHMARCLGADGTWEYESGVTDAWIANFRHDRATALTLARDAAPHLTVNGRTVADVLEGVRRA